MTTRSVRAWFELLFEAGVPVRSRTVGGARWYHIDWNLPPLRASQEVIKAMVFARYRAAPLNHTRLVARLDRHLEALGAELDPTLMPDPPEVRPEVMRDLDDAVTHRFWVELFHEGASGKVSAGRRLAPWYFSVQDGQPYITGFDLKRRERRTFMIARMSRVVVFRDVFQRPDVGPEYQPEAESVWSQPPELVTFRVRGHMVTIARERPLRRNQRLIPTEDGALLVAHVGEMEAALWALRGGPCVEALHPPSLRARVQAEVAKMHAAYAEEVDDLEGVLGAVGVEAP